MSVLDECEQSLMNILWCKLGLMTVLDECEEGLMNVLFSINKAS